ncbi:MAG: phage antirepressor [Synergistaceae bacterium]|jgi:anti-repressor protein|nr:phage antirepressor [Synergistaceae bacterium]
MMDTQDALKIFDFDGRQVRVVEIDGQPWWVAKDICNVLGLTNPTEAIKPLDDDEKMGLNNSEVASLLGLEAKSTLYPQGINIISESGIYTLITRSNKPEARRFRRWLTSEVLPSIRKYGGYLTDKKIEEVLADPDTIIQLARNIKAEKEKCRVLEAKIDADRPKVIFAESVEASRSSILVGDLAKLIRQNGYEIGPKRFFEWLRQNGYLMKNGESRNMPTQKSMEAGLFEVKERAIDNPDGTVLVTRTTKVTGRGQLLFINLFRKMSLG